MTNRNRVRLSKLALGLSLALAAAPVFAQSTSSGVGGLVTDASGNPVAGADVTITHVESGTVSHVTTDASGRYNARGLRVGGPYTVKVEKSGVGVDTENNVYLVLSQPSTVNAQLGAPVTSIGTVTVVANASTSVFSAHKMGAGTSVDQETIKALPSVNGNIQDYMRLDPRVAFTDRASGSISAGGMNPRFNKITIDGVSASDTFGLEGNNLPTMRQPVSLQAIEAIDVNLSNYDVTMAGAAGANVNAVTKSGTNEYHGSVYGMFRDSNWFGEYPARVAGSTLDVTGLDFDEFDKDSTWGFTFGGPIMKDKLFFFVNYEKLKQTEIGVPGGTEFGTNPLAAGADFDEADVARAIQIAHDVWGFDAGSLVGGDTELEEYAAKLDWNINESHRASFRYSNLDQTRVRPEASSASGLSLSSNWYNHHKTVKSYVGQVFSDWSENFSTEFKVSYRDYDAIRENPTTAPTIQIYFDDGNNANNPSAGDFIRIGTERSSMGNALQTNTWNWFGTGTWTHGDHDVKFGFEWMDNEVYNYFLQDSWGNYSFLGLDNFEDGIFFDYDLQYQTAPGSVPARFSNRNLGLFVQDTWYYNDNLTLTLGLRADKPSTDPQPEFNADFAAAQTINPITQAWAGGFGYDNSNTFNGKYLIQPRVGFNYTFDSERQMQLRGGIGLFQGDSPNVWVSNSYQSTGLNYVAYSNYRSCAWPNNVPGQIESSRNATCIPYNPANPVPNPDGLDPLIPPSASANRNVNVIDDDFALPSVWKANLGWEMETGWFDTVFSAEALLTQVNNGLFYESLNLGPGFTGPDGRTLYWNPTSVRPFGASGNSNRFHNNPAFGDVYLLKNTGDGESKQLTFSLSRPFSKDRDWSWSLAYTYTDATEVGSLTSSTAGSGYGSQLAFNVADEEEHTARYEIKDRIAGTLDWKHAFFGDYETRVGLVYEGRSGRPFSYIFSGDANGDSRTFNDLFYVPNPGEVLFGTLNSTTGAFTANPVAELAFFSWLGEDAQHDLLGYQGHYAPENGFRAGWVNTFDLRFTQQLPGFMEGHHAEVWFDIQNVGNLINKDWGHIVDYGFNANQAVATLVGICQVGCPAGMQGKYVYNYRSGTEFGQDTALGLPTNADGQTNGISQWSLQVGFKYEF